MNLSLEKIHLPSIKANRSTKEAKIKEHRIDGDNLSPDSFKDKLMEEQQAIENELMGKDEELKFDIRDVIVEKKRILPSIFFSPKIHSHLVKPWQSTVVVKLLRRNIGHKVLCSRLEALWDAQHVLTQGPWIVLGHYLTVQLWSPHFDSAKEKISSIVAWMRLPRMPLHYYHEKVLRLLGQVIGNVVRIDYST
ncbi:hypothetical protein CUMW_260250 [Citrus unshiu]|uniref:DUF4283 domain-containing protein n=2 Tax=Citrus TaxID=2706 RepID=A0A067DAR5_CITSI|nr:hypothetical protein CISIN_1g043661mg [Citrus sinensis]GAY67930.1 hypothetical protein CUMW_260250 [Citrus unshiu]